MVAPPSGRPLRRRQTPKALLYLSPTILLLLIFSYYPPLVALIKAFYEWNGANQSVFIGLKNFRDMAHDEILLASVFNMGQLVLFSVFVGTAVPIFVSELIFNLRSARMAYLYRLLFVVPAVVPAIVILLLWQFIFDPDVGLLNALLHGLGVTPPAKGWLGNPDLALYCFMAIGFPWVSGVAVLIFLAGLMGIDPSLLDSSRIDGCGTGRRIVHLDLPLIMGQIKVMVVIAIIGGLQGFGGQLVVTNGGPGYATMVPGLHMFHQAFNNDRMGAACAIGFVMFGAALVLTVLNMKYLRSAH